LPSDLSNLDLDEVSLVGKAANAKTFLIFKGLESESMTENEPEKGIKKDEPVVEAPISKSDLESIRKELADAKTEKDNIKKALDAEIALREKNEFIKKAASFPDVGFSVKEGENRTNALGEFMHKMSKSLSAEEYAKFEETLKSAQVAKSEAMKILGVEKGYNGQAAPDTPAGELAQLVAKELAIIEKSADAPKDPKVREAIAIQKVSEQNGKLAARVLAQERAEKIARQISGGV
jgi:hypothetical protein